MGTGWECAGEASACVGEGEFAAWGEVVDYCEDELGGEMGEGGWGLRGFCGLCVFFVLGFGEDFVPDATEGGSERWLF